MMYRGKSEDGSDGELVDGVYVNPNNPNEWSSRPYPKQVRQMPKYDRLKRHLNGRSVKSELVLIQHKKSKLSKSMRDYVLELCKGYIVLPQPPKE